MKFKTPYNAEEFNEGRCEKKNTLPSLTVPDQTLSIREIVDRYSRGLPITGGLSPVYLGEEDDFPDPRTLDLSELAEMAEANNRVIEDYRKDVLEQEQKRKHAELRELFRKELESELAVNTAQSTPTDEKQIS